MLSKSRGPQTGTTLIEVLVTAAICAIFFISIFEVNAVCLRLINTSKENVGALECVQDRLEQLRNLSFTSLVDTAGLTTFLTAPPNSSTLPLKATETVTIRNFVSGAATTPSVTFVRGPGASVPPTHSPSTVDFTGVKLVQIDVSYNWVTTFGAIAHRETTSTIISAGTKK